jgi:hypothetical protein
VWLFLLLYVLGIIAGVWANRALNVQLKRPGLAKSMAAAILGVLLAIFIATHNITMPGWLLAAIWAGIGLLAGLGSREARAPI